MGEMLYNLPFYEILKRLYQRDLIGFTEEEIQAAEKRLHIHFPKKMREYYLTCGEEDINDCFNHLFSPENIVFSHNEITDEEKETAENCLMIWAENQGVCHWGIHEDDLQEDNPKVYITTNNDFVVWEPCYDSYESFKMEMLLEQLLDSKWDYSEFYDGELEIVIEKFKIDLSKLIPKNGYANENKEILTCMDDENLFLFKRDKNDENKFESSYVVYLTGDSEWYEELFE